jgi:hypothetical protein
MAASLALRRRTVDLSAAVGTSLSRGPAGPDHEPDHSENAEYRGDLEGDEQANQGEHAEDQKELFVAQGLDVRRLPCTGL